MAAPDHPHPQRASEAFFGRRKGPPLGPRKQRLTENLLPVLSVDLSSPPPDDLAELFDRPVDKLQLEIGFGGGEHLTHQAKNNPATGFIGVEPFINGMAKMLGAVEDHGLDNVRLYDDDATQLLDWLPDGCVSRIDLLYPDPWPKRRNWKRRFVNQRNLTRFHQVLQPGGIFHFASDIDTYLNWTLNHVHKHGGFDWQAQTAEDWHQPYDDWIRTRYEAKAIREGRTPCYLSFVTR